jgi:FAD/FMN-containing dehydrogenase
LPAAPATEPQRGRLLFQIGGALGELPADHSPAGNRDAAFVINIAASWENAADDAACVRWSRDCFEATRAFSTGGTYINFLTEEEGRERIEAAYGRTALARLAAIKRQVDPDNLFRHTKSIAG